MNREELYMVVRKLLTVGGAALVARGFLPQTAIDDDTITGLAGLILLIVSTYWSKQNVKRIRHAQRGGKF